MTVHARPVVAKQRFRHERRRFAELISSIANDILEDLQAVGCSQHRRVTEVDLTLTSRCHFVVMTFNRDAALAESQ